MPEPMEIQVPCLDEEKGTIFSESYQYDSENIAKENLEKYEDNYLNIRKYMEAKFGMKYSFKEYINYWHDKIMPVWTQSQAYIRCFCEYNYKYLLRRNRKWQYINTIYFE